MKQDPGQEPGAGQTGKAPLRRKTRPVKAGPLIIGGGFPISLQTMAKKPLHRTGIPAALAELEELSRLGCGLCRFSVPTETEAELFVKLCEQSPMPLAADIHFDHRLALKCLEGRAAKIRINPGNIGPRWKVAEVAAAAADKGAAIRVGINAGSLPTALRREPDKAGAMVRAALEELNTLESLGFRGIVFSLKASDPDITVAACRDFAGLCDYPLHLGVTEAGGLVPGLVKSSLALYRLLSRGIGDTLRVSLCDSPALEVQAGAEILKTIGLREGLNVISCPRCGRSCFDEDWRFLEKAAAYCATLNKKGVVAVMGCPVNGPEEARHADLGITGAAGEVHIYRRGRLKTKTSPEKAWEVFKRELDEL
ncbi:MAG: (E)-4-hydroxy-3-methylbut-2-enyl-diphosphate synthase [Spirochaetales bacterium]|jgi:(E)-4-hydroxy-3-methylbut-2-enyl-diphosphate synthase|nr:(E)-4-hydroxy-3-methylbut-2-enyl-diphosphate synthase [Spirochaetales bacterium]